MAKQRVFRVELQYHDLINGADIPSTCWWEFPDASRASAFASSFRPEGEPLPLVEPREVFRSAQARILLYEVI